MPNATLESQFTQEDLNKVIGFVEQATRVIVSLDEGNFTMFQPEKAPYLIEGLRPYAEVSDSVQFLINTLMRHYKEITGKDYKTSKNNN